MTQVETSAPNHQHTLPEASQRPIFDNKMDLAPTMKHRRDSTAFKSHERAHAYGDDQQFHDRHENGSVSAETCTLTKRHTATQVTYNDVLIETGCLPLQSRLRITMRPSVSTSSSDYRNYVITRLEAFRPRRNRRKAARQQVTLRPTKENLTRSGNEKKTTTLGKYSEAPISAITFGHGLIHGFVNFKNSFQVEQ